MASVPAAYGDLPFVEGIFFGVKPAVLALVLDALLCIGRLALGHAVQVAIAAGAFAAIFLLAVPFPWIVPGAGLIGLVGSRLVPDAFRPPQPSLPAGNVPIADALLDHHQVVQFVGFLGAYRSPGDLPRWLAGTLAAVLATWVTYVPCFLWIFLGASWIERLRESRMLRGALAGITVRRSPRSASTSACSR